VSLSRPGAVAALAVVAALLSGCGGAQPGVAVKVGDETISSNRIDELAGEYCTAIEDQLTGNSQRVPQRYFRAGIASSLAMRSVAEQLAAEYDVEPGSTYDQQVAELQQSVAVLDEDVQESVIEVESSKAYVEAVQAAVGEVVLEQEGDGQAEYSEQVKRGQAVFEDWISEHGLEFDPSLGIGLVKGKVTSVDTSLSFPVGDNATNGSAEEPDAVYAAGLPDSHRCG
jgi:hypothetical protein